MKKIIVFLSIYLFLIPSLGWGATYYVKNGGDNGANGLSDETAWETFTYAFSQVSAGDTVSFKKGDTFQEADTAFTTDGTESDPITFNAYGAGADPILKINDNENSTFFIRQDADWVTWDGLTFDGNKDNNTTDGALFFMAYNPSSNVSWRNCVFQNCGAQYAIQINNYACQNLTVQSCTFQNNRGSIKTGKTDTFLIDDTTFTDNEGMVYVSGGSDVTITNITWTGLWGTGYCIKGLNEHSDVTGTVTIQDVNITNTEDDIEQSCTPDDSTYFPLYGGSGTYEELGQSFTTVGSYDIQRFLFYARRVGSPGDQIYFELSDSIGGAAIATSNSRKAAAFTSTGDWYCLYFSTKPTLSATTKYYVRAIRDGARDTSNYVEIRYDADNVYVDGGVYIKESAAWGAESGSNDFGFMASSSNLNDCIDFALSTQLSTVTFVVERVTITNPWTCHGDYGIVIQLPFATRGTATIRWCELYNLGRQGIGLGSGNSDSVIAYNWVENCGRYNGEGITAGIALGGYSDGTKVYYNVVNYSRNIGIGEWSANLGGNYFYNNIVINCGYWGDQNYDGGYHVQDSDGSILKNNIAFNCDRLINVENTVSNLTLDNNAYYGTTYNATETWRWLSTDYTTFADYKSASSQDANSKNEDVKLQGASNDNFALQSDSPCINAGVDVGLTQDYAGRTVPAGPGVDIGAYEYGIAKAIRIQMGSNITLK